jgi:hypothetical protein
MLRTLVIGSLVGACGGGSSGPDTTLVGECDPARDSVDVPTNTIELFAEDCLRQSSTALDVVETTAQWDALFDCEQPVPQALDFTTQRAAIVHPQCTPVDFRFTAETSGEVVIGVLARVSGACLSNILVVPLPRSTKPVRVATCQESCEECPPVP